MEEISVIEFDQAMLAAIYRALSMIPAGYAPAAASVKEMIGDMMLGLGTAEEYVRNPPSLPSGFRLTIDFDYAETQGAVANSIGRDDLAERLASLLFASGGQALIGLVLEGMGNGSLAAPLWLTEGETMHTPHAVNSMAKYDREQRERFGDSENATAVIGKFQAKGVQIETELLPGLHERLAELFLERRTNGHAARLIEARVAQPPHREYGESTPDRAFAEILVQAFSEVGGVSFKGDFWWVEDG